MQEVGFILLGWILFAGTHTLLSHGRIRATLVGTLGLWPFRSLYSLIALGSFGLLVESYRRTRPAGPMLFTTGMQHPAVIHGVELGMVLALLLVAGGLFNRSAMIMTPSSTTPYGWIRVTRHPINMGLALFGLLHMVVNRALGDWIFFGGLAIYSILGSLHQDQRFVETTEGKMADYFAATSVFPFVAILQGRQTLRLGELSKIGLVIGLLLAVGLRMMHPSLRS